MACLFLQSEKKALVKLTLDQKEEAEKAGGGDDQAGHDEGQAPGGGDESPSDQRAQDVPHRRVGVPHPHDEPSSAPQSTRPEGKTSV